MISAIAIGIGITITTLNVYKMMAHNPAGEKSAQLLRVQLWSQGPNSWEKYATTFGLSRYTELKKH